MGKHVVKKYYDEAGLLIIKPYLQKDLAAIFDINRQTLKKWMGKYPKQLGEKDGKHYSIKQVEFMLNKFGAPRKVVQEVYKSPGLAA